MRFCPNSLFTDKKNSLFQHMKKTFKCGKECRPVLTMVKSAVSVLKSIWPRTMAACVIQQFIAAKTRNTRGQERNTSNKQNCVPIIVIRKTMLLMLMFLNFFFQSLSNVRFCLSDCRCHRRCDAHVENFGIS